MKHSIIVSPSIFYTSHPLDYPNDNVWNANAVDKIRILQNTFNAQVFLLAEKNIQELTFNYQCVSKIPYIKGHFIVIDTDYLRWLTLPAKHSVICTTFYGFEQKSYSEAQQKLWQQDSEAKHQKFLSKGS